jgi:hypothetical protein
MSVIIIQLKASSIQCYLDIQLSYVAYYFMFCKNGT